MTWAWVRVSYPIISKQLAGQNLLSCWCFALCWYNYQEHLNLILIIFVIRVFKCTSFCLLPSVITSSQTETEYSMVPPWSLIALLCTAAADLLMRAVESLGWVPFPSLWQSCDNTHFRENWPVSDSYHSYVEFLRGFQNLAVSDTVASVEACVEHRTIQNSVHHRARN